MQSSVLSNLLPFVTSEWESHSLLNIIYIVADAMTAALYIPLSKVLDVWGRPQGFAFMTLLATVGMIMMAACHNLATFCAAYVRDKTRPALSVVLQNLLTGLVCRSFTASGSAA